MAPSIAGVFWRAVRLVRECRRGAVCFGRHKGMFPGRYSRAATLKYLVAANDYDEL